MSAPKKSPEICGIDMPLLAKMDGIKKIIVAIDNAKLTNITSRFACRICAINTGNNSTKSHIRTTR